MQNAEVLLIGISQHNSYFSQERINRLLQLMSKRKKAAKVIILGRPTISTYIAGGYPPHRARKFGYQQVRRMQRRANNAIAELPSESSIDLIDRDLEIEPRADYQQEVERCRGLYIKNKKFNDIVLGFEKLKTQDQQQ